MYPPSPSLVPSQSSLGSKLVTSRAQRGLVWLAAGPTVHMVTLISRFPFGRCPQKDESQRVLEMYEKSIAG